MKHKRMKYLILIVVIILGMLSGCGDNRVKKSNSTQETSTTENQAEIINNLDIPDLWKQELSHAMQLDMPMDKVQQDKVSGKEMMELLDWFVEYAAPEALDDWKNQLSRRLQHRQVG